MSFLLCRVKKWKRLSDIRKDTLNLLGPTANFANNVSPHLISVCQEDVIGLEIEKQNNKENTYLTLGSRHTKATRYWTEKAYLMLARISTIIAAIVLEWEEQFCVTVIFLQLLLLYGYIICSWLSLSYYEVLYTGSLSIILITQKVKQLMICSNEL